MEDHLFVRVDFDVEWNKRKLAERFMRELKKHRLLSRDYLYRAFDGKESIGLVTSVGCDAPKATQLSCGTRAGLNTKDESGYDALASALLREKPGLLVYKRRSLVVLDDQAALYRFKGKDFMRGLVAIVLAKRPRSLRSSELTLQP